MDSDQMAKDIETLKQHVPESGPKVFQHLPESWVKGFTQKGKGILVFGCKIDQYDREELFAIIGHLLERQKKDNERYKHTLDVMSSFRRV